MAHIYNVPGEGGESMEACCENAGPQMEGKFIKSVVELVVEALNVGWMDRRLVQPLLEKALSEKMDKRYQGSGLIQQYEAYVLETAGERIMKELDVPDDVKINHSHATHAKFADIVDWIKENYSRGKMPPIEDKPSEKGTK